MADSSSSEKSDIIRKFILNAPAGELRDVLRPLKLLTEDDDLFFSVIPQACLEYTLRHQSIFVIPENKETGAASVAVLCSKQNHFLSRLKCGMKSFAPEYDSVADGTTLLAVAAAEYLSQGEAHLGVSVTRYEGAADTATGFEDINRVFFDYTALIFFEIDPVEGRVVRTLPFMGGGGEAGSVAALVYASVESCLEADSHDLLGVAPYLIPEIAKYVLKSYTETQTDERTRMMIGGLGASSPTKQGQSRQSTSLCASHISVHPSGNSISIHITSERSQPKSFYTGRWKSMFVVEQKESSNGTLSIEMVGETRVHTHYYEEGNIHMEVVRLMEACEVSQSEHADQLFADVASIAKKLAKEVKTYEVSIQRQLEQCCTTVGEVALKGLRRKLPISKQEFNFRKATMMARPM